MSVLQSASVTFSQEGTRTVRESRQWTNKRSLRLMASITLAWTAIIIASIFFGSSRVDREDVQTIISEELKPIAMETLLSSNPASILNEGVTNEFCLGRQFLDLYLWPSVKKCDLIVTNDTTQLSAESGSVMLEQMECVYDSLQWTSNSWLLTDHLRLINADIDVNHVVNMCKDPDEDNVIDSIIINYNDFNDFHDYRQWLKQHLEKSLIERVSKLLLVHCVLEHIFNKCYSALNEIIKVKNIDKSYNEIKNENFSDYLKRPTNVAQLFVKANDFNHYNEIRPGQTLDQRDLLTMPKLVWPTSKENEKFTVMCIDETLKRLQCLFVNVEGNSLEILNNTSNDGYYVPPFKLQQKEMNAKNENEGNDENHEKNAEREMSPLNFVVLIEKEPNWNVTDAMCTSSVFNTSIVESMELHASIFVLLDYDEKISKQVFCNLVIDCQEKGFEFDYDKEDFELPGCGSNDEDDGNNGRNDEGNDKDEDDSGNHDDNEGDSSNEKGNDKSDNDVSNDNSGDKDGKDEGNDKDDNDSVNDDDDGNNVDDASNEEGNDNTNDNENGDDGNNGDKENENGDGEDGNEKESGDDAKNVTASDEVKDEEKEDSEGTDR